MHWFHFDLEGFRDTEDQLDDHINRIGGYELASFLSQTVSAHGLIPDGIFQEDYGWVFFAKRGEREYFITAQINYSDSPAELSDAHVSVDVQRTLVEKVLGRNRLETNDEVLKIVEDALRSNPGVTNFEAEQ